MTGDTLGPQLRELRVARGMTQVALAERLGIASAQVSQIESGYYTPSIPVLETILGELDAHLEIIMDENEGGVTADSSRLDFPPAAEAL